MKAPLKLAGFGAILVAVLAIGYGIGNAVGPVGRSDDGHHTTTTSTEGTMSDQHADHQTPAANLPGGLQVSQAGYTLQLDSPILPAGDTTVAFRVIGPDHRPVTDYAATHDKDLHLIAVRRDTTGFQHVHPTIDPAGTWTAELTLSPGTWRLFADFRPAALDRAITLGIDAQVAGDYQPQPLPDHNTTAAVDGYTVTLSGGLVADQASELTFTVHRDGEPVTDLEPCLAAYGHLVALRAGDLAYLHVHPEGSPGDGVTEPGPHVAFAATAPSAGAYRLFLDFQHDGVVRTAEFTAPAGETTTHPAAPADDRDGHG
ncbi:MAG TPA: heavy-metal-associated domain-containing protein [Ilumatobacter sp.]|nr:heavy-metal-associated domain-containing protein [Ilumatobacter sp.]